MHYSESSASATDLLDSYLDKQLNGVSDAIHPHAPPIPASRASSTTEWTDTDYEKFEDLRLRCRLLKTNLDDCERLEQESDELIRKLNVLKSKCKGILSAESAPSVDSESMESMCLTAEGIRRKYPCLFTNA